MELKTTIADVLELDHSELDELLRSTMEATDSADAVQTFKHLDRFWARLAMHIRAEHLRVFPVIRKIATRSAEFREIPELLDVLREDHDFFMRDLARAIKAMRLVFYFGNEAETFAVVRKLLEGVRERLAIHNRIEEAKVYTLATEELFEPAAIVDLLSSVRKDLDNYPDRFATGSR